MFSKVHDDPLLIIRQQEKKTRENILSNPLKLAKQVEGSLEMAAELQSLKGNLVDLALSTLLMLI